MIYPFSVYASYYCKKIFRCMYVKCERLRKEKRKLNRTALGNLSNKLTKDYNKLRQDDSDESL